MEVSATKYNDQRTANAFWQLIKPQSREVRRQLAVYIYQSLAQEGASAEDLNTDDVSKPKQLASMFAFIKTELSKKQREKIDPFVSSLGVDMQLPADFDEKKEYRKHLEEKYR